MAEKDRKITEAKLIKAVRSIMVQKGFRGLKINEIAKEAGVSKVLIYRYFGDLDGLLTEFMKRDDFWMRYELPAINEENISVYIKKMFREQVNAMRENILFKEIHLWELSEKNPLSENICRIREENGLQLIEKVHEVTGIERSEVSAIATILSSAVTYLALFEKLGLPYNGIDLQSEEGWNAISNCIDGLIDSWIQRGEK